MNQLPPVLLLSRWIDLHGFPSPLLCCNKSSAVTHTGTLHQQVLTLELHCEPFCLKRVLCPCSSYKDTSMWLIGYFKLSVLQRVVVHVRVVSNSSVHMIQNAAMGFKFDISVTSITLKARMAHQLKKDVANVQEDEFRFCWNTLKTKHFDLQRNTRLQWTFLREFSLKASMLAVSSLPHFHKCLSTKLHFRGNTSKDTLCNDNCCQVFLFDTLQVYLYAVLWSLPVFDRHMHLRDMFALLTELIQFLFLSLPLLGL